MVNFFSILLPLFLCVSCFSCPLQGQIKTLESIQDIAREVDSQTVIFFNITGTLYEPANSLGDRQWREHFSQRVCNYAGNSAKGTALIDLVKSRIVQEIPKKPVEEVAAQVINHLQDQQVAVFGLTQKQMSPSYASDFGWITYNHLVQLGIDFEKTLQYCPFYFLCDRPLTKHVCGYGILFLEKNPIGEGLVSFLQTLAQDISQVIIVDNSETELRQAEIALAEQNIPFVGYHYHRAQFSSSEYDTELGTLELLFLVKKGQIINDAQARAIRFQYPIDYEKWLDEWIQTQLQM